MWEPDRVARETDDVNDLPDDAAQTGRDAVTSADDAPTKRLPVVETEEAPSGAVDDAAEANTTAETSAVAETSDAEARDGDEGLDFEQARAHAVQDDDVAVPAPASAGSRRGRRTRQRPGRRVATIVLTTLVLLGLLGGGAWWWFQSSGTPIAAPTPVPMLNVEPTSTPTPTPTPSTPPPSETAPTTSAPSGNAAIAGDTTSATSITVLVNKLRPLSPIDYVPGDLVAMSAIGVPSLNGHSLRSEAASAVRELFAAASAHGIALDMTSGYRGYESQSGLYSGYVQQLGQAGADATSARPGYSEHQTGLAADISSPNAGCVLEQCFAETKEGVWLAAHAWEYGFILRYPKGMTDVTGYEFEPWHFRYVGVAVSTAMHQQGVATYEEFLGTVPAPGYAP